MENTLVDYGLTPGKHNCVLKDSGVCAWDIHRLRCPGQVGGGVAVEECEAGLVRRRAPLVQVLGCLDRVFIPFRRVREQLFSRRHCEDALATFFEP